MRYILIFNFDHVNEIDLYPISFKDIFKIYFWKNIWINVEEKSASILLGNHANWLIIHFFNGIRNADLSGLFATYIFRYFKINHEYVRGERYFPILSLTLERRRASSRCRWRSWEVRPRQELTPPRRSLLKLTSRPSNRVTLACTVQQSTSFSFRTWWSWVKIRYRIFNIADKSVLQIELPSGTKTVRRSPTKKFQSARWLQLERTRLSNDSKTTER